MLDSTPHISQKPLVGITLGDPAGIGPEVTVLAAAASHPHSRARLVALGRPEVLRRAVKLLRAKGRLEFELEIVPVRTADEVESSPTVLPCLSVGADESTDLRPGEVSAAGGEAAYEAVVLAARLARSGALDAITTAPLSKAALWKAGHHFPGHTELLGELCEVADTAMMLYLPPDEAIRGQAGLGVVHTTLHLALRDVFQHLTPEKILTRAEQATDVMTRLKGARPTIGVCALNPHAGEEGLFGDEEQCIIAPAVAAGIAAGLPLVGPLPADTLLVRAKEGEFDGIVAMYHDQGHIALKLLGMHRAVNVTLGLPIVRTSVAHGTAADRAWQGTCDFGGMLAALEVAAGLVAQKKVPGGRS
jgi:4-hydroxythreonine-4-phosphate dehydrogenase